MTFDFSDRNAWYKYVATPAARALTGIETTSHQTFKLRSRGVLNENVRSMLSVFEIGLLYALARDHWQGRGAIIDAGPLLGASTFALGLGLSHNHDVPEAAKLHSIYSFDLWIADEYYTRFIGGAEQSNTQSLLGEFLHINRDFLSYIIPHQGDFCSWKWQQGPIEILFMDLAKTWGLNRHYVVNMLPYLIPDGVLIQQDYVHYNEYWIHLTMEYFAEHFELSDVMYGATAVYRMTRPLTIAQCQVDLEALPYEKKMELLASARTRMPSGVQQVMKCAAAKCALENRRFDDAEALLDTVDTSELTKSAVDNFSGIAKSNEAAVRNILAAARAKMVTA